VFLPGWGGQGDVAAQTSPQSQQFARAGYIVVSVGFHQTEQQNWHSDLGESTRAALDQVCADSALPTNCGAIALVGTSYGGTQSHPVLRYLQRRGYDGTSDRNVVAFLSQDAGYTLYWDNPKDAQLDHYSGAMIENLGDTTFPVDSCADNNCGARDRVRYHLAQGGASAAHLLSYCPAGGNHGVRTTYAGWDQWVLDAVKTMLHVHQGAPQFSGYVPPVAALGPNGIAGQGQCVP
jgi:hypothetical protein